MVEAVFYIGDLIFSGELSAAVGLHRISDLLSTALSRSLTSLHR